MSQEVSNLDDAESNGASRPLGRRQLIKASAWAAPAIVLAAAVPAAAASGGTGTPVNTGPSGSVPVAKLVIDSSYKVDSAKKYDAATKTNRGPLRVYVRLRYNQGVVNSDPSTATVPWTVAVTGPSGPSTLTGTAVVAKRDYSQTVVWYPGENSYPMPAGKYTFVLTIYGSDGSKSQTINFTIA